MPANLTPQYKEAEERFRKATTREEKLDALREMLALLPKHKGTEKIQADLRHRVAKIEQEAAGARRSGPQRADPGHVPREGAGQWVLLGPPNAGKSALLRALTSAHPEVAPYPFTTRLPQPGMMHFEDVQVQIVDTPAVTPQHTEVYMANVARNADGVAIVLDLSADDLEAGLQACQALLDRARVHPAAHPRPADASPAVVVRQVLVVLNKVDQDSDGTFAELARDAVRARLGDALPVLVVSAEHGTGLEPLRETFFRTLRRIRIYAKEPGKKADMQRPFVLPEGATVHDLALAVHRDIAERLKYARLWGRGARFDGQQVDRDHVLADRDIVELHA
jgi:hypothetical protein